MENYSFHSPNDSLTCEREFEGRERIRVGENKGGKESRKKVQRGRQKAT